MRRYCDHFTSLKSERVGNFLKKTQVRCSFRNHISEEYNVCLNCGQTRCGNINLDSQTNNEQISCSEQHWNAHKHPLVLKIFQMQIYCFSCQRYVLEIQGQLNKADRKKIQRINDLNQLILNLAKKLLSFSKHEPKIVKTNLKKDKKVQDSPHKCHKQGVTKKQSKKQNELRVFGISNIGNTCYFNSVLQCLYATSDLHQLYKKFEYKDDFNLLIKKFFKNTEKTYCPKSLFNLISKNHKYFKRMEQHDAFELYVILINSLIESANKEKKQKKESENVGNIFGFSLISRLQCMQCKKISWNKDFSLGLSIPLVKKSIKNVQQSDEKVQILIPKQEIGQQGLYYPSSVPTNTFLDWFFAPQIFGKSNSYSCEKCSSSNALHKFYLKDAPSVLTINFKRFHNNGSKNDAYVAIPQYISLNSYCLNKQESYEYEIYGAVVHSGSSKAGHYIAYTRRNNEWFYFSDQHFKPSSFHTLKSSHPYVVFYERINQQAQKKQKQSSNDSKQIIQ